MWGPERYLNENGKLANPNSKKLKKTDIMVYKHESKIRSGSY